MAALQARLRARVYYAVAGDTKLAGSFKGYTYSLYNDHDPVKAMTEAETFVNNKRTLYRDEKNFDEELRDRFAAAKNVIWAAMEIERPLKHETAGKGAADSFWDLLDELELGCVLEREELWK